ISRCAPEPSSIICTARCTWPSTCCPLIWQVTFAYFLDHRHSFLPPTALQQLGNFTSGPILAILVRVLDALTGRDAPGFGIIWQHMVLPLAVGHLTSGKIPDAVRGRHHS